MVLPDISQGDDPVPLDRRLGFKLWDKETKTYRWWNGRQWTETYSRIENETNDQVAD